MKKADNCNGEDDTARWLFAQGSQAHTQAFLLTGNVTVVETGGQRLRSGNETGLQRGRDATILILLYDNNVSAYIEEVENHWIKCTLTALIQVLCASLNDHFL